MYAYSFLKEQSDCLIFFFNFTCGNLHGVCDGVVCRIRADYNDVVPLCVTDYKSPGAADIMTCGPTSYYFNIAPQYNDLKMVRVVQIRLLMLSFC